MLDRKIKHIHSSCGFPAKGEKGKIERFQVCKIPGFLSYSSYPVLVTVVKRPLTSLPSRVQGLPIYYYFPPKNGQITHHKRAAPAAMWACGSWAGGKRFGSGGTT